MITNFISLPLITFSISMCITPGPNNVMLASSGANYGFKRTIPHIIGVEIGMLCLFILSAFGLGIIFTAYPEIQLIMKICSSIYLLYFAYKITFAKRDIKETKKRQKPLSVLQAALFQVINPKALIIISSSLSSFTKSGKGYLSSACGVIIVFALICIPSISVWAGFGSFLRRFLKSNIVFRIFNAILGSLTALSILMIIK